MFMPITKFLFLLNITIIFIFAFAIKTGLLESFLSKIGNIRVKKIAKDLEMKREQY